jgi:hypothetical protein
VTEPQKHTLYEIKATNLITRSGDKLLDPFLSTVTFNGIPLDRRRGAAGGQRGGDEQHHRLGELQRAGDPRRR